MIGQLLRDARKLDKELRANSICEVCGKPKEGFQRPVGGRWVSRGSDEFKTGCMPETRESAGLCTCESETGGQNG